MVLGCFHVHILCSSRGKRAVDPRTDAADRGGGVLVGPGPQKGLSKYALWMLPQMGGTAEDGLVVPYGVAMYILVLSMYHGSTEYCCATAHEDWQSGRINRGLRRAMEKGQGPERESNAWLMMDLHR